MSRPREDRPDPVLLALRGVIALLAVAGYLAIRQELEASSLVAARFGLGILLFALLLDVGRSIAGVGPPIHGSLGPHEHRPEPQADANFSRLRAALHSYVQAGRLNATLAATVQDSAGARQGDQDDGQRYVDELREAASDADEQRPLAVRLLSGAIVSLGLGLAAATLAETLGMAVVPPVLLVTGSSIAMMQWRAQAAGARWIGLGLGLTGTLMFGLAGLTVLTVQPGVGLLVLFVATTMLAGTLWATWRTRGDGDPWPVVEQELEATLRKLRWAFGLTVVAGIVAFPLQSALSELLNMLAIPPELAFELGLITFVTVSLFLVIEAAGTWMALTRGRRRAARQRDRRLEATLSVMERLDAGRDAPTEVGP